MPLPTSALTHTLVVATAAAAACWLGGLSGARADTLYTNQASFLSALAPGSYLETFDSLPQNTLLASPLTFSQNGFSYTAATTQSTFYNAGPAGDVWLSTNRANDPITFTITGGGPTAIGGYFFPSDISGSAIAGSITLTLTDGGSYTLNNSTATSTSFVGFTTTAPITSFTLTVPDGTTWNTANNLIVGVVPEPSTYALVLGSLILLGFGQRARCIRRA